MCIVTHWKLAKMQIPGFKPRDPGNSNVDSPRPNFKKTPIYSLKANTSNKICTYGNYNSFVFEKRKCEAVIL